MQTLARTALGALALVALTATPVQAQVPGIILLTPTASATFTASPDHALVDPLGVTIVTRYDAKYYLLDAAGNPLPTPAFVTNLGKPTPDAANVIAIPNAFSAILPNTAYRIVVDAVGPGGAASSNASDPFGRSQPAAPRPTSKPVIVS